MKWFIPLIAVLIIIGSASSAAAWIMGPARGLSIASQDNDLPPLFKLQNKKRLFLLAFYLFRESLLHFFVPYF